MTLSISNLISRRTLVANVPLWMIWLPWVVNAPDLVLRIFVCPQETRWQNPANIWPVRTSWSGQVLSSITCSDSSKGLAGFNISLLFPLIMLYSSRALGSVGEVLGISNDCLLSYISSCCSPVFSCFLWQPSITNRWAASFLCVYFFLSFLFHHFVDFCGRLDYWSVTKIKVWNQ